MKNIPKVAHLCWFGHHPMPLLNLFTVVSFHRLNPDWKIKVYYSTQTMRDFGSREWLPPYEGQDYFDSLFGMDYVEMIELDLTQTVCPTKSHIVCASDVFRQHILFTEGGLYSDFDVLWMRPMSYFEKLDVIGDASDFQCTVSMYHNTHGFHNVSNIIAEKGSKFLSDLLHVSKKVRPPFSHQAYGTDLWNKHFPTLDSINSRYDRMCALKYETFFPFDTFQLEKLYFENDIKPAYGDNTLAVHWFGANPLTHHYINTGMNSECAMTTLLRLEGLV